MFFFESTKKRILTIGSYSASGERNQTSTTTIGIAAETGCRHRTIKHISEEEHLQNDCLSGSSHIDKAAISGLL